MVDDVALPVCACVRVSLWHVSVVVVVDGFFSFCVFVARIAAVVVCVVTSSYHEHATKRLVGVAWKSYGLPFARVYSTTSFLSYCNCVALHTIVLTFVSEYWTERRISIGKAHSHDMTHRDNCTRAKWCRFIQFRDTRTHCSSVWKMANRFELEKNTKSVEINSTCVHRSMVENRFARGRSTEFTRKYRPITGAHVDNTFHFFRWWIHRLAFFEHFTCEHWPSQRQLTTVVRVFGARKR